MYHPAEGQLSPALHCPSPTPICNLFSKDQPVAKLELPNTLSCATVLSKLFPPPPQDKPPPFQKSARVLTSVENLDSIREKEQAKLKKRK